MCLILAVEMRQVGDWRKHGLHMCMHLHKNKMACKVLWRLPDEEGEGEDHFHSVVL